MPTCDLDIELTGDIDVRYEEQAPPCSSSVLTGPAGPPGPTGPTGPPASEITVVGEIPAGAINGSNATFTSAFAFIPESVEVFINGLAQRRVDNFNTTGTTTIILSVSPGSGESIMINYVRS